MYLESFFEAYNQLNENKIIDFSEVIYTRFQIAFQPIVNIVTGEIYAYEALVRGENGESAIDIISKIPAHQLYRFDQTCRVLAIETAVNLGINCKLSINFFPNAIYNTTTCISMTLAAAKHFNFPLENIILENSETEKIVDYDKIKEVVSLYKQTGVLTAIDDFGAGYAGLGLLANFKPNIIKLDVDLIRTIDSDNIRLAIVEGIVRTCDLIDIKLIAEGVETIDQYKALNASGITLMQGYLLAKPVIGKLVTVNLASIILGNAVEAYKLCELDFDFDFNLTTNDDCYETILESNS